MRAYYPVFETVIKSKIKYLESSGDISDRIKKIEDYIDNVIEKSPNDKKLSIYLHNPKFFFGVKNGDGNLILSLRIIDPEYPGFTQGIDEENYEKNNEYFKKNNLIIKSLRRKYLKSWRTVVFSTKSFNPSFDKTVKGRLTGYGIGIVLKK